jgi:hypothetical protein
MQNVDRSLQTALVILSLALATPAAVRAAESPHAASTSRTARDEALRAIPYSRISQESQAKVNSVLANVSMFRRMPTQVTRCDPKLYLFMVNHPDVTVNLWQVLDVTTIQLQRTGPVTFRANDGQGTKGDVEFLYRSHDQHLVYATGTYEGPLLQNPIHGSALLLLKTAYTREPDGQDYVTSQLDVFFNLEHVGLDLLTRTFHPLMGKSADYNFIESATFLGTLTRTGELKPATMQALAGKLTRIDPQHRDEFAQLMAALPAKAAERGPVASALTPAQPVAVPRQPVRGMPNLRR